MRFKLVEDFNIQYGVHSYITNDIMFRGTEKECVLYIENNHLLDSAEVYSIYPDDPYYLKEDMPTQYTIIYPKIDKENSCYVVSKEEYEEWD